MNEISVILLLGVLCLPMSQCLSAAPGGPVGSGKVISVSKVSKVLGCMLDSTWWNANYAYRRLITITNNAASPLSSNYSTSIVFDTASMVSAGKMLPNGDDLRIVSWNGSSWVEIDRDIISGTMNTGSTQIWFKTQTGLGPAPSATNDYYLYYGNPSATNPPANKSNVYLWFDDFNRPNEADITTEASYMHTNAGTWSIENNMSKNVGPVEIQTNSSSSVTVYEI